MHILAALLSVLSLSVRGGRLGCCFGVYENARLKAGRITIQGAVDLVRDVRSADSLRMATCLVHIRTQTQLQVLRGAASILESLQLRLVLQDHSRSSLPVSPAPIANLSESKVQIRARHTHPVANALCILLLRSLLLLKLLLLL